ncbi:MAG: exosortase-associated protein EpsI, B-type [Pseudomonadota bacterium]
MQRSIVTSLALCVLMVSASALSRHLTPTVKMADQGRQIDLASVVPAQFGEWAIDASVVPLQVDPATQAKLDRIYNQTLSRTYINAGGERVMLSLAYGGDQSDTMAVHKPEVCYAAQGFDVQRQFNAELRTGDGTIPVKRLYAVSGARHEPITYWITVGDQAIRPGLQQKLQQLRYGLSGTVPDGMLVRVSTIGDDTAAAYALQDRFVGELLRSMPEKPRARLAGVFGPAR